MDLDADPQSLVAAYLSRQEGHPHPAHPHSAATVAAAAPTFVPPIDYIVDTPYAAAALFVNRADTPNLNMLYIRQSDDAGLAMLATMLRSVRHAPFTLALERQGFSFSHLGLAHLPGLNLSKLSLSNAGFSTADVIALAAATFPIDIALAPTPPAMLDTANVNGNAANAAASAVAFASPFAPMREPDDALASAFASSFASAFAAASGFAAQPTYLQCALRLPTLSGISIYEPKLSPAEIDAIQRHPSLGRLAFGLATQNLQYIMANPRICLLSIVGWELADPAVSSSLAIHPSLQSFTAGYVEFPEALAALARNQHIVELDLRVMQGALQGMSHLAAMPALRSLTLRAWDPDAPLRRADIDALCRRPWTALKIQDFTMDGPALSRLASVHATSLYLGTASTTFTPATAHALAVNPHIAALSLTGDINSAAARTVAASATLQKFSLTMAEAPETRLLEASVRQTWEAAKKPPEDLVVWLT